MSSYFYENNVFCLGECYAWADGFFFCDKMIFIIISSNPIRQEIANWIVDLGVELEFALIGLITYVVDFGVPNLPFRLLLI